MQEYLNISQIFLDTIWYTIQTHSICKYLWGGKVRIEMLPPGVLSRTLPRGAVAKWPARNSARAYRRWFLMFDLPRPSRHFQTFLDTKIETDQTRDPSKTCSQCSCSWCTCCLRCQLLASLSQASKLLCRSDLIKQPNKSTAFQDYSHFLQHMNAYEQIKIITRWSRYCRPL